MAANDRSISDVDSEPASPGYDESVHAAGDALVSGLRRSLSFQVRVQDTRTRTHARTPHESDACTFAVTNASHARENAD